MKQPKHNKILNEEIEYSNNHIKRRKGKKAKKTLFILSSTLYLGFKGYIFKKLSTEMFNNTPSVIYDSNKNILAQIGAERNRENINYDEIPQELINAYISIEDKRYFSHHGVDIKRTAAHKALQSFFVVHSG